MAKRINAAAYYRMSSDKQEASIADQRTAVVEFAAANGYNIVREYKDEAISGWKSEQRKGFQQLITDANSGDFQAVLCWDQDRFSRFPVLEANHYWYLLDRAGVHITTIAQGRLNFEDLGEWLKASVVQHGKAEYVRDLARNSVRGQRTVRLSGRWSSIAPLGYRLNDGRLELGDESAIATVKLIFDMRARGYGFFTIAKTLNSKNIPSARGSRWAANTIRSTLKRPCYIGNTVVVAFARGRYERVIDGQKSFENTHPAIIDKETWNKVQEKWNLRAHSRLGNEGAPLAGLLICGRCKKHMYASGRNTYLCGSYRVNGTCGCCAVDRGPILAAVAAKLREHVLMGSIDRLQAAVQRQLDRRQEPVTDTAPKIRKLESLDRQIARAADRLLAVDDSLVSDLQQSLMALKSQRAALAAELDTTPTPKRLPTAKAIASKIWELDRILSEASATTVRHALSQLIDHIRLDFKPGKKNARGQSYRFAGGAIKLRTQEATRAESRGVTMGRLTWRPGS